MESLMADGGKNIFKDGDDFAVDGESEDYSNWDISYEEIPPGPTSSVNARNSKYLNKNNHRSNPKTTQSINPVGIAAAGNAFKGKHGNHSANPSSSSSSSSSNAERISPVQPDWQKVQGTREKFHVYSAYYNSVFE